MQVRTREPSTLHVCGASQGWGGWARGNLEPRVDDNGAIETHARTSTLTSAYVHCLHICTRALPAKTYQFTPTERSSNNNNNNNNTNTNNNNNNNNDNNKNNKQQQPH